MDKTKRHYHLPESASGALLLIMTVIAMAIANSRFAVWQQHFIDDFIFWINEVLMAVFFLAIGLELKHGFQEGLSEEVLNPLPTDIHQSSSLPFFHAALLPGMAALGGMLVPALIYIAFNHADPVLLRGWATPIATDIAFAVGVLSLFGTKVPPALKLFLLALAIFDDLGAVIVIALFYSAAFNFWPLMLVAGIIITLWQMNRSNVPLWVYLLVGLFLWVAFLKAGLHPTLSGFLLALFLPNNSATHQLEKRLKPWIAFLIMPLFAFANAGFSWQGMSFATFSAPIVIGIMTGLFFGKQLGVCLFSWLTIKSGWARLPAQSTWFMLYGVSLLCGIGFTMSLFLGTLAFAGMDSYVTEVRLGVMAGSILSGLAGALILKVAFARK